MLIIEHFERGAARFPDRVLVRDGATTIVLHGAQAPLRTDRLYQHLTQTLPRLGIALFLRSPWVWYIDHRRGCAGRFRASQAAFAIAVVPALIALGGIVMLRGRAI